MATVKVNLCQSHVSKRCFLDRTGPDVAVESDALGCKWARCVSRVACHVPLPGCFYLVLLHLARPTKLSRPRRHGLRGGVGWGGTRHGATSFFFFLRFSVCSTQLQRKGFYLVLSRRVFRLHDAECVCCLGFYFCFFSYLHRGKLASVTLP